MFVGVGWRDEEGVDRWSRRWDGKWDEGKCIFLLFLYERGAMGMTYLVLTVYVDLIVHVFLCSIG